MSEGRNRAGRGAGCASCCFVTDQAAPARITEPRFVWALPALPSRAGQQCAPRRATPRSASSLPGHSAWRMETPMSPYAGGGRRAAGGAVGPIVLLPYPTRAARLGQIIGRAEAARLRGSRHVESEYYFHQLGSSWDVFGVVRRWSVSARLRDRPDGAPPRRRPHRTTAREPGRSGALLNSAQSAHQAGQAGHADLCVPPLRAGRWLGSSAGSCCRGPLARGRASGRTLRAVPPGASSPTPALFLCRGLKPVSERHSDDY